MYSCNIKKSRKVINLQLLQLNGIHKKCTFVIHINMNMNMNINIDIDIYIDIYI